MNPSATDSAMRALQLTRVQDGLRIAQLETALRPFVEGFKSDPGTSDLDNEQPIVSWVKLGEWRKAVSVLAESK